MFMWVFLKPHPWLWHCACPLWLSQTTSRASGGSLCKHLVHMCWRRNMSNNLLSYIFNCLLKFSSCLLDVFIKNSTYRKLNVPPLNQLLLVIFFFLVPGDYLNHHGLKFTESPFISPLVPPPEDDEFCAFMPCSLSILYFFFVVVVFITTTPMQFFEF